MDKDMMKRVMEHGLQLIAIFPKATEPPMTLCRKLRRLEVSTNRAACDACNTQEGSDAWGGISDKALAKVQKILGSDRPWINPDPRGYALKVDLAPDERLHRDWGGYGIIAPDLTES